MVIPPNNVGINGNNRGSGYIIDDNDSLILTHHHSYNISLDVLNTLNQVPLNVETRLIERAIHTNTFLIYFQEKAEKGKKLTNKAKKNQ